MIIDAVIPLLIEHGRGVTTRQIAEQAGIAEGTIFRAFGDKESLVRAAIDKHLDPGPLRAGLASIDRTLPLDRKICRIVELMRGRFRHVFGFMAALGEMGHPPVQRTRTDFVALISDILAPDLDRLGLPPDRIAHYVRLVTFASAIPQLDDGAPFDEAELADFIIGGILRRPSDNCPTTEQDDHAS